VLKLKAEEMLKPELTSSCSFLTFITFFIYSVYTRGLIIRPSTSRPTYSNMERACKIPCIQAGLLVI